MITPTQLAEHLASKFNGDQEVNGIARHVTADSKGTILAFDLADPETGEIQEAFILAVISAPVTA